MNNLEAIVELAKVIRKAKIFDNGQFGKVMAVPITDITEIMVKLAKPKAQP